MDTSKKKKKTHKETKRELLEAKSSTVLAHVHASSYIGKCSTDKMMGSGVLLQLTGIGGKDLINPILIRDGLSEETIEAIKKDIKRSYDLNVEIKL